MKMINPRNSILTLTGVACFGALLATAALPAVTTAASKAVPPGYYAGLSGVKSTDLEFNVRPDQEIRNLAITCDPKNSSLIENTSVGFITISAPALMVKDGNITYKGPAKITAGSKKTVATTTLAIDAHFVDGPEYHYTYQGTHFEALTAFKGTATSPACVHLPRHGGITLFGDAHEVPLS
jgi:hypothetical protein